MSTRAPGRRERRVGMLAPMEPELAPLARELDLVHDGELHRGRVADVEVVALVTTMGMAPAEAATTRVLEADVDRVIVVGIAGGIDMEKLRVGDLVVPATVVDRRTGESYGPPVSPHVEPSGTISCGDDLILDDATLAELDAAGVLALDMETAAVAAVCTAAGVPWSVFRSISDFAGEGLVDQELFEATNPDGTGDPEALSRYLEAHPEKLEVLARLAQDCATATEAAAAAAIRSCLPA